MGAELHVLFKFAPNPYGGVEIDTTSSSGRFRGLSPFVLGPIWLPELHIRSENFENLWQYSKVYEEHIDPNDGCPTADWYYWRRQGFGDKRAHRYPKGKGRKPRYSSWEGKQLGYVEARTTIYAPIYAQFVAKTASYKELERVYEGVETLILRDFDAYDHIKMGMSLAQVLKNPQKKCGHAFILAMMLAGERPWEDSN